MESSGSSMFAEIGIGTAQQLVLATRYINTPPGPTFLPSLDEILNEARPHAGGSTLQRGDLLEVVGASGSGKTAFLLFLLMTTLLPTSVNVTLPPPYNLALELPFGGRHAHAALLHPTSHKSPLKALEKAMVAHMTACAKDVLSNYLRPEIFPPIVNTLIQETVHQSMARLHVIPFRPSWRHLLLAIRRCTTKPDHANGNHGLTLLVIDGMGDPFWPERWANEDKAGHLKPSVISNGDNIGMKDVMAALQGIRRDMGTVVALSVQGLWSNTASPFFIPHMPAPYPAPYQNSKDEDNAPAKSSSWPLNLQLTLTGRIRGLQAPADLTLIDALRNRDDSVLDQRDGSQGFDGIVRVPGGAGEAGTLRGKHFDWRIGHTGLEAWSDEAQ